MDVREWAHVARVGEEIVYARGVALPGSHIGAQARRAHRERLVFLYQRRRTGAPGFEWVAVRISAETAHRIHRINEALSGAAIPRRF